jgi:hypothetical protein
MRETAQMLNRAGLTLKILQQEWKPYHPDLLFSQYERDLIIYFVTSTWATTPELDIRPILNL